MRSLFAAAAIVAAVSCAHAAEPQPVSVTFSPEEQQAYYSILDIAVKAGGLQVAGIVDLLAKKMMEAQKAAAPPAAPTAK